MVKIYCIIIYIFHILFITVKFHLPGKMKLLLLFVLFQNGQQTWKPLMIHNGLQHRNLVPTECTANWLESTILVIKDFRKEVSCSWQLWTIIFLNLFIALVFHSLRNAFQEVMAMAEEPWETSPPLLQVHPHYMALPIRQTLLPDHDRKQEWVLVLSEASPMR